MAMNDSVLLAIGVLCAAAGGELFVRGILQLAQRARVAPVVVASTLAAMATSSPELSVAVSAALAGQPQIGLGDSLGSNVVNIALVLALPLLWSAMRHPLGAARREFRLALLAPAVTAVMLLDGTLSRLEGGLLMSVFWGWLWLTFRDARQQPQIPGLGTASAASALGLSGGGMLLLMGASRMIVQGAEGIAAQLGVDSFVVGATLVAVGTSAPELATALVARRRGHDEIGLGTLLGSNLFNGLFIAALAAIIHPIAVDRYASLLALLVGAIAVTLILPTPEGRIGRERGLVLLILYGIYLVLLLGR